MVLAFHCKLRCDYKLMASKSKYRFLSANQRSSLPSLSLKTLDQNSWLIKNIAPRNFKRKTKLSAAWNLEQIFIHNELCVRIATRASGWTHDDLWNCLVMVHSSLVFFRGWASRSLTTPFSAKRGVGFGVWRLIQSIRKWNVCLLFLILNELSLKSQ